MTAFVIKTFTFEGKLNNTYVANDSRALSMLYSFHGKIELWHGKECLALSNNLVVTWLSIADEPIKPKPIRHPFLAELKKAHDSMIATTVLLDKIGQRTGFVNC